MTCIKMAARWNIIILVLVTLWHYCSSNSFPVPLLIWSSKSLDVDDEILAGHTLSYEDIQDKYLDKLNSQSNTICVFKQDKLSIDDFAAHQNNYLKNLKDVLSLSSTSIVLPSVALHSQFGQSNNNLVEYFKKKPHGKVLSLSAKDVTNFPKMIKELNPNGLNIIIIHLPSSQSEENGDRNLVPSDNVIGKISEELTKYFPDYVGLLTADMPRDNLGQSMLDPVNKLACLLFPHVHDPPHTLLPIFGTKTWQLMDIQGGSYYVNDQITYVLCKLPHDVMLGIEENRQMLSLHVRSRRDAETSSYDEGIGCSVPGVWVETNGRKLYFRNITLTNNSISDSLENSTSLNITGSSSNNNGSNITLTFSIPPQSFINGSSITLSFLFLVTGPYWSCQSIEMNGSLFDSIDVTDHYDCSSHNEHNVSAHMDVPDHMSFACDDYRIRNNNSRTLTFRSLQVEPQRGDNSSFSNSVNCVGFFTPPIWMGLLTVGVLVAILYGGVLSLLSIKCMDRFDNPNDPTIVIHNE